jgi:hypothetical protein
MTQAVDLLTRLGVLVSISLTVSGQAAVRVVEVARAGLARVVGLPVQVAASVIGRARVMSTRFARLLTWLRWSLMTACQGAARVAIEAASAGMTQALAASRVGAMRILERTAAAGTPTRPFLRVCTGIVGMAVLVVAIVMLWPRQRPDNLLDRKPAELAVPAPVARTPAPGPVSAPQAAPAGVSRSETPRATMRPRPIDGQDEIPAPVRRADPTLAQRRTTASAPLPSTEATQNAEAPDPTAAIDWLLKGGSSRRHTQSP